MPQQDTTEIKKRIILTFRQRGPSLPVHIANATGLSMLFSSAFLSELVSEKELRISNMKVGNSPIYYIPGQEPILEKFSMHLKSKEKDAFELLKQKKFLIDTKQEPAIRVALRSIRDFAKPFKKDEQIIWRYLTIPESEFKPIKKLPKPQIQRLKKEQPPKQLDIFEKKDEPKKEVKKLIKKTTKKTSTKVNEKFFNKVKAYLSQRSSEISGIEGFSKTDLTLKIRKNGRESLLIAFNKKRITEKDIIKAHKQALEIGISYKILCLGEQTKKLNDFIEAVKNLEGIGKLE
jgi:hypothetical protein